MKIIYLLIAGLLLSGCKKEKTAGPWNLKDGQEVEVMIGHKYGATDDLITLLPQMKTDKNNVYYFFDREPGYNYRVKARMVAPDVPPEDGPSYWLELVKVLSKEKYTGSDSFVVELVSRGWGTSIMLRKEDNLYDYLGKLKLTPETPAVAAQFTEMWDINEKYMAEIAAYQPGSSPIPTLKWKSIKARVTHNPENFGKSYLVSELAFVE